MSWVQPGWQFGLATAHPLSSTTWTLGSSTRVTRNRSVLPSPSGGAIPSVPPWFPLPPGATGGIVIEKVTALTAC
ncbi:hypothetical protein HOY80DRAFT_960409 [Tuber brumale]|nr:hypothetical protein HOY80DRAFT_960409 [Tuber brumale]